jgi:hypothetical protein
MTRGNTNPLAKDNLGYYMYKKINLKSQDLQISIQHIIQRDFFQYHAPKYLFQR